MKDVLADLARGLDSNINQDFIYLSQTLCNPDFIRYSETVTFSPNKSQSKRKTRSFPDSFSLVKHSLDIFYFQISTPSESERVADCEMGIES